MTLAEVGEIFAYWAENPPTHLLVQFIAGSLGWRPPARASDATRLEDLAAPPPGIAVAATGLGMPAPLLDRDQMAARNRALAAAIAQRTVDAGRPR